MTRRLVRRVGSVAALVVGVVATGSGSLAAQEKKAAPSVAGSWTMSVETPHGAMAMGLALKQTGTKVTGTFDSPHGNLPVEGEFADGTLTLSTTSKDPDTLQVTFTATLKDGGVLAGYLSSTMGDMKWSAERVKDKR